jgi:hypothetical protein
VLRYALEEVNHDTLNTILTKKIFAPLTMSSASITIPDKHLSKCACGYTRSNEPARAWDDEILIGSAALRVSSADMLAFLKAALGLPGTPASLKKAMELTQRPYITISNIRQGLGWEIRDLDQLKNKDSIFWGFPAHKPIQQNSDRLLFLKKQEPHEVFMHIWVSYHVNKLVLLL